ncbi:MAG: hypothetical protein KJ044_02930, partial [Planctomycetes bacterium]|nr:hypothetical protein [Planctomycetota bacterium]
MIMWRCIARTAAALTIGVLAYSVILAQAQVVLQPGGNGPTGNFNDANGQIEMCRGGAATWADGNGRLRANDPALTKAARGIVVDNKECTGVITEAINPHWTWSVSATMTISSNGYTTGASNNKVEGRGRGELALWGDGGPAYAAAEVTTTNQHAPGNYDIDIVVNGFTYTVSNGGSYHKLANPLGGGGGFRRINTGQTFTKFGPGWRMKYESRASGLLEIDFSIAGRESASFTVSQSGGQ